MLWFEQMLELSLLAVEFGPQPPGRVGCSDTSPTLATLAGGGTA